MDPQQEAIQRAQQNAYARSILMSNSVRMIQQIYSGTINVANNNVLNIQPRNVGLTMGFIVEVECNITNAAVDAANLTGFGGANFIKQLTYTDLNNVNRIQTTGYHLALLNSARQGFVFGGAYNPQSTIDINNNYPVIEGANIAAAGNDDFRFVYYVPLAYAADDFRGAVYTNVVNATQNLQIVLQQEAQAFVATGADPLNAVLIGNAGANYTNNEMTVTVYQIYRDQIPFANGIPILPVDDLNLVYDIKNLTLTGMAENQDFPFAYPNMRQFYSTIAIYDNAGTFNVGTDINYWSLLSANQTQMFKVGPLTAALFARQTFMADPPPGVYYLDIPDKPIDTITFGNMTLNLNASDVTAGASLIICTEAFQQVNQIPYASSLAVAG
jgi:hypothetical protein